MITPAYAPTATERVLPRMALDFTTGVLDSRVTISRALNTATRVNSSGFIEVVNANLPRFDYDPVTLAPKGLLIEEARTNLIRYSIDFTNALWLKFNASPAANATTSPDGTTNATKLVEAATTGVHAMYQEFVVVSGTAYTASIFVKAAERTWCVVELGGPPLACSVYVNLATGATGTQSGSPSSVVVTPYKDGWWRIQISKTASAAAGAGNLAVYPATGNGGVSYAGNGTSGIFVYGGGSEAGAFATSYIPTTTTTVARNADVVSMTGTNFSSWANASAGALQAKFANLIPPTVLKDVISLNSGPNNFTIMRSSSSGVFSINVIGGASVASLRMTDVALNVGQNCNGITVYSASRYVASANARSVSTNTTVGAVPPFNTLSIGSNAGSNQWSGWMQKISYWPQLLTDAEVQSFSK